MQIFQLLEALDPELTPAKCKIHLAVSNGKQDPLDVYLAGDFEDWQAYQNAQNFKREFVLSLIAMPERDQWLFAGVYRSLGCKQVLRPRSHYRYDLEPVESFDSLEGRMIVDFKRRGRQSYLLAEKWSPQMLLSEVRPVKHQMAEFPGYSRAMLTKQRLDIVVEQEVPSWKNALENVGGVYVISDLNTGMLYIGSAYGQEGIWSRWCTYSANGHGGNCNLKLLLKEHGEDYADNFQFGVLEIADYHASAEDIIERESYWKELLLSRDYGYNAN